MKSFKILLFLLFVGCAGSALAQETSLIQQKKTRFIAKLDLYWSTVMVAENFPSFFPIELELNLPAPRISVELIASPWGRTYSTQTRTYQETSFSGGLGLRYYPFKSKFPDAATGFFLEPQFLMRFADTDEDSLGVNVGNVKTFNGGPFLGIGYQHEIADIIFIQGRVSVGTGRDDALSSYQIGNKLTVLPWVGFGIALH